MSDNGMYSRYVLSMFDLDSLEDRKLDTKRHAPAKNRDMEADSAGRPKNGEALVPARDARSNGRGA